MGILDKLGRLGLIILERRKLRRIIVLSVIIVVVWLIVMAQNELIANVGVEHSILNKLGLRSVVASSLTEGRSLGEGGVAEKKDDGIF